MLPGYFISQDETEKPRTSSDLDEERSHQSSFTDYSGSLMFLPDLPYLPVNPVLDDQLHLIPAHAPPAADPDLHFQQVEEGMDCGKIRFGGGELALPGEAEPDQLGKVLHLTGHLDDIFERHRDRQVGYGSTGRIVRKTRFRAIISGTGIGHSLTTAGRIL